MCKLLESSLMRTSISIEFLHLKCNESNWIEYAHKRRITTTPALNSHSKPPDYQSNLITHWVWYSNTIYSNILCTHTDFRFHERSVNERKESTEHTKLWDNTYLATSFYSGYFCIYKSNGEGKRKKYTQKHRIDSITVEFYPFTFSKWRWYFCIAFARG